MTPEIEQLLSLLEQPADALDSPLLLLLNHLEQCGLVTFSQKQMAFTHMDRERELLAALAFRLRDEVVSRDLVSWERAATIVTDRARLCGRGFNEWRNRAQPKHFIVAALIAKKMKEQRGDVW